MRQGQSENLRVVIFVLLFICAAFPGVTSPVALIAGMAFSLLFGNPLPELTAKGSKTLLKISVVGLGFGVNFFEVIMLGKSSLPVTLVFILATVGLGALLGRILSVSTNIGMLISFGTAICGGSAIAAMAPVLKARSEEIAVSLATVFSLNALALLLFPPLGHLLQLSQQEFGLWSALAIHDTSSVVGASATFGAVALAVGTTTKLTRALWIVPCAMGASLLKRSGGKVAIPFFIFGFIATAFINSWLPDFAFVWNGFYVLARQILVMTLFLVGAGLTRQVLRQVGIKPLLLGGLLWVVVSGSSLALIMSGYIR